jgi:PBP1b-binding outer membrane lipoprotein LpoB
MKKLSLICLLVAGIILISGCIDGETSPLDNNSSASVPEISQPELIPDEFEINKSI